MSWPGFVLATLVLLGCVGSQTCYAQSPAPIEVRYGVRVGGIIGLVIGSVLGVIGAEGNDDVHFTVPSMLLLGGFGAGVGMLIGGLVTPGEQWERVPSESLAVGPFVHPDAGTGFALGFRF